MRRLFCCALLLVVVCGPALADVHALVVGVDLYASVQQLRGSANDARDIAEELSHSGVRDLVTLVDGQATLARFDQAWDALLTRAEPGDVIFLSFSGHGIRVPELKAHTTPDGFQKGFLLQPYNAGNNSEEILRDEDLYDRFALATERGLKIFFVADACHAGAAVRGTDPRVQPRFRFQRFEIEPLLIPQEDEQPPGAPARPANPNVTVFSATDERLTIQEVVIDDKYRGALSYAIARGLNKVGSPVNVVALQRYVAPLVRVLSSNRQIPQFTVPDETLELLSTVSLPDVVSVLDEDLPSIGLAIVGEGTSAVPSLEGVHIGSDNEMLTWDVQRHQMLDASGDVVLSGLRSDGVQNAIDARRVLESLRDDLAEQPSDAGTTISGPSNVNAERFFLKGDVVTMAMHPGEFAYATMVDITANGTIQLLWPVPELDPPGGAISKVQSFGTRVNGPYGADYVVTVLSREPLTSFHAELAALHNTVAPLAFYAAYQRATATTNVRLGINAVFTCESLRSDGKCDTMLAF